MDVHTSRSGSRLNSPARRTPSSASRAQRQSSRMSTPASRAAVDTFDMTPEMIDEYYGTLRDGAEFHAKFASRRGSRESGPASRENSSASRDNAPRVTSREWWESDERRNHQQTLGTRSGTNFHSPLQQNRRSSGVANSPSQSQAQATRTPSSGSRTRAGRTGSSTPASRRADHSPASSLSRSPSATRTSSGARANATTRTQAPAAKTRTPRRDTTQAATSLFSEDESDREQEREREEQEEIRRVARLTQARLAALYPSLRQQQPAPQAAPLHSEDEEEEEEEEYIRDEGDDDWTPADFERSPQQQEQQRQPFIQATPRRLTVLSGQDNASALKSHKALESPWTALMSWLCEFAVWWWIITAFNGIGFKSLDQILPSLRDSDRRAQLHVFPAFAFLGMIALESYLYLKGRVLFYHWLTGKSIAVRNGNGVQSSYELSQRGKSSAPSFADLLLIAGPRVLTSAAIAGYLKASECRTASLEALTLLSVAIIVDIAQTWYRHHKYTGETAYWRLTPTRSQQQLHGLNAKNLANSIHMPHFSNLLHPSTYIALLRPSTYINFFKSSGLSKLAHPSTYVNLFREKEPPVSHVHVESREVSDGHSVYSYTVAYVEKEKPQSHSIFTLSNLANLLLLGLAIVLALQAVPRANFLIKAPCNAPSMGTVRHAWSEMIANQTGKITNQTKEFFRRHHHGVKEAEVQVPPAEEIDEGFEEEEEGGHEHEHEDIVQFDLDHDMTEGAKKGSKRRWFKRFGREKKAKEQAPVVAPTETIVDVEQKAEQKIEEQKVVEQKPVDLAAESRGPRQHAEAEVKPTTEQQPATVQQPTIEQPAAPTEQVQPAPQPETAKAKTKRPKHAAGKKHPSMAEDLKQGQDTTIRIPTGKSRSKVHYVNTQDVEEMLIDSLKEELEFTQNDNSRLAEDIEKLKTEKIKAKCPPVQVKTCDPIAEEVRDLEVATSDCYAELDTAKRSLESERKQLDALNKEVNEERQSISSLQQQISELNEAIAHATAQSHHLQAEFSKKSTENHITKDLVASAIARRDQLVQQLEQLRSRTFFRQLADDWKHFAGSVSAWVDHNIGDFFRAIPRQQEA